MDRLPPIFEYVGRLRSLLDENRPSDILNHPWMREAARAFVKGTGSVTRPQQVAQAIVFAAELERERSRALFALATWPCHDHPPSDSSVQQLFDLSAEQEPMIERARSMQDSA